MLDGSILALITVGLVFLACTPLLFSEKLRRYWLFAPAFTYLINNEWVHCDDMKNKKSTTNNEATE